MREKIVLLIDVVGPSEEIQLLSDEELPDHIEVLLAPMVSPLYEQSSSGWGSPKDDIKIPPEPQPQWGAPNDIQELPENPAPNTAAPTTEDSMREVASPSSIEGAKSLL